MDFGTLIRIVFRQWYVVVPTIALVALVGTQMVSNVESEYSASGSVVLLSPSVDFPDEQGTNPYARFSVSLRTTAFVVRETLLDKRTRGQIEAAGFARDYDVVVGEESPILTVSATANSRDLAIDTVKALLNRVPTELATRQALVNVPTGRQITSHSLTLPFSADERPAARNRAIAALCALGISAMLGVALVAESLTIARRTRRRARLALSTRERLRSAEGERAVATTAAPAEWTATSRQARESPVPSPAAPAAARAQPPATFPTTVPQSPAPAAPTPARAEPPVTEVNDDPVEGLDSGRGFREHADDLGRDAEAPAGPTLA